MSQMMDYQIFMQVRAGIGQIEASFVLLAWAEANELLSHSDEQFYPMFPLLLEASRVIGNTNNAQVQEAVQRVAPIALAPLAMARTQGLV